MTQLVIYIGTKRTLLPGLWQMASTNHMEATNRIYCGCLIKMNYYGKFIIATVTSSFFPLEPFKYGVGDIPFSKTHTALSAIILADSA